MQTTNVLKRYRDRTAFKKTMNNGASPMETDASVERAWVDALSDERVDDAM